MKHMRNSKKGFDVNQMFIFVTAIVVVGFVILFGTKTIGSLLDTSDDIVNLQLKNDLEQLINLVKNDHGSQKFFEAKLPSEFTSICFFDIKASKKACPLYAANDPDCECPTELNSTSVRSCPLWTNNFVEGAQPKNLILVRSDKSVADPLYIPGIRIENISVDNTNDIKSLCVNSRLVELRLRGERQEVYIAAVE